jgi:predicted nucleic acid-binding protein
MSAVIADTGPVHYLILIEQISLLPVLFETIFIPETVRKEMLAPRTPAVVRQWITTPPAWLQVVPDPAPVFADLPSGLDEGERAAVQLALSMPASLLLMDDRAGVAAAISKGLVVTGTLGILKLAAIRDLVDIESALNRLLKTNFRYPPSLIQELLHSLRKDSPHS